MKSHRDSWSRRYRAALHRHMKDGASESLSAALRLGGRAVALRLEPLDMASIHKQALLEVKSSGRSTPSDRARSTGSGAAGRAKHFFTECLIPVEETHPAARKSDVHIQNLTRVLRERTRASKKSSKRLKEGIAERKAVEVTLKTRGRSRAILLKKSDRLHEQLRAKARAILSTQEEQRLNTSRRLHDEIAQTLVAINLRLLALKTSATSRTENLVKEFASTRRVVQQSVAKLLRVAKQLRGGHES